MRKSTKALIQSALTTEHNAFIAELLFLEHQVKLPPQHRKTEMDESEMGEAIKELRVRCRNLWEAIADVNEIKTED